MDNRVDTSLFEWIAVEERDGIGIVKLNRPEKLNAWNPGMQVELNAYLDSLNEGEYRVRAIVLTGEGRAFCAGGDVGRFSSGENAAAAETRAEAFRHGHTERYAVRHMRNCDVPIIGAINGYALGMGFGLALATDLRICAENTIFQVAQTKRGLMADFGLSYFLPQVVGTQRALELMFSGRRIEAQEALDLGLVLEVVPPDRLLGRAIEIATDVAAGPPIGLAASKHVVYAAEEEQLVKTQQLTNHFVQHLFRTEDATEGVRSFVDRREPQFRGR